MFTLNSRFELKFSAFVCSFVTGTLKLHVGGRMDFGPEWNYGYGIEPAETRSKNPESFTVKDPQQRVMPIQVNVKDTKEGPKIVDIVIQNDRSKPILIDIAEPRIYDKTSKFKNADNTRATKKKSENIRKTKKEHKREGASKVSEVLDEEPPIWSDEHTNSPIKRPKLTKTGKRVRHLTTIESGEVKPNTLKTFKEVVESVVEESEEESIPIATIVEPQKKHKRKNTTKKLKRISDHRTKFTNHDTKTHKTKTFVRKAQRQESVTDNIDLFSNTDISIKPRFVKDDKKIKEFTKHVYEQSIKVLESIKDKMATYDMKKEAERLMRTYEDKFGDFVRDTQSQKIRTRLGTQKVILNTLDTSNRILERLAHYLLAKMDGKGILRTAGGENFILDKLNKKKELENKHICNKLHICRSKDSFTDFIVDILSIISSADDKSITTMRDACTEVLKNINYNNFLDSDTEKRFQKGISDIEKYDANTMRSLFLIMKNILSSRNTPIKVVGKEDSRINKTVAFLEMINSWEKRLPPNEKNMLDWNDMRTSFREWKDGSRKDTVDLVQHLAGHVMSVARVGRDNVFSRLLDTNINTMLGY